MRSSFLTLAFLCLVITLSPTSSLACSCLKAPPPDPNTAASPVPYVPNKDEAVFEGTVVEARLTGSFIDAKPGELISANLDEEPPFMLISFDVSRSYFGEQGKKVELRTGLGGGDCGYPFEVGKQYLVYAWKDESGQLSTGICSGTGLLDERKADVASLRGDPRPSPDAENPAPLPTRLCGHVVISDQSSSTENRLLLLRTGNKSPVPSDEAEIDADGLFCATNVEPGEYYLLYVGGNEEAPTSFGFFPGVTKLSDAKTIVVAKGQPVDNLLLKVPFQPSYSVSGVVASSDKTNADLRSQILLFSAEHPLTGLMYRQELSPNRGFALPHVLPGKYWAIVAVEPDDNSKWFTTKVAVDVDNNVSGLSLTLTQGQK